MPANDRFRSNEEEVPPPVGMQPPDQDPEEPVPLLRPQSALRTERYLPLLTQEQIPNGQSRAGSREGCERSDEQGEKIDHLEALAASPVAFEVLPSHSTICPTHGIGLSCAVLEGGQAWSKIGGQR